jgi:pimeloyl-ACP methyl ester carboxylesterase
MARAGWRGRARSLGRKLVRVLAVAGALACAAGAAGAAWEIGQQRAFERAGYDPPGKLVDVGGRRLHLACSGSGEPGVMLISGLGGTFASWGASFRDSIAGFSRVCAYDRAGIGWSDPAETPRTADAAARDLAALLAAARPFDGPPVVVGHSIGGLYALRYARMHPADVSGLVLIDPTTAELYDAAADWRSDAVYHFVWPALGRLGILRLKFRRAHGGLDRDSLDLLAGVASGYPAGRIVAREYGGLEDSFRVDDAGARTDDRGLRTAPGIVVPLVVLSAHRPANLDDEGSMDRDRNRERNRDIRRFSHARLAADASDGRMIEIDSDHYIFRERPDTVVAVIRSVVTRTRPGADSGEGNP